MKKVLLSFLCIAVLSCKETSKEMKKEVEATDITAKIDDSKYPEVMQKVFEAHGGLATWKSKRTLSFGIPQEGDEIEKQTIDLHSRHEKIEMPEIVMGANEAGVWLLDEKKTYKGDPVFYHNLMFYFYAMPFVLSDDGINYSEADSIAFEGTSYPGIRISYNDGVGLSAKDEYYIHYNPETFQMEWLGYTVTFGSDEKSNDISWIKYNEWQNVGGLILPKSIAWYANEGRTMTDGEDPLDFENVTLSETAKTDNFFSKPKGAKIVNSKK